MFDKLTQQKKLDLAKQLFSESIMADTKWQTNAREDFLFRDGEQWTRDEKRVLAEEMRPCLTFNLTKSSIDLIMGMNQDNKIQHRCSPVDPTDGFLAEVLNDLTEWVQESNGFEEEEDVALKEFQRLIGNPKWLHQHLAVLVKGETRDATKASHVLVLLTDGFAQEVDFHMTCLFGQVLLPNIFTFIRM